MDGDHACSIKCIAAGEKHMFVAGGKIYEITNQDFAGLNEHEGYAVVVTGTINGHSITVSKIESKAAATPKAK